MGTVGVDWSIAGSIVVSMVVARVEFRSDVGSMLNFSGLISAGVTVSGAVTTVVL